MSLQHGTDWENPTARRRFIDRAWHTFVGDGVAIDGVSPEIARSWERVRDTYGVDPALRRCTRAAWPTCQIG